MKVLSILAIGATAAVVAMLLPAGPASAATTPAAGIQIRLAHDNLCLNVSAASTADKAPIVQYTCSPSATNDKFKVVPRGSDSYWIQAVGSGKCLNVSGGSLANGGLIVQYTCTNAPNTLWKVDEVPDQPTVRFQSAGSGKCLNLPNAQTAIKVQLIQYTCTSAGAPNEKFYMPPTTSATATHRPFTSKQPISVVQGGAVGAGGVRPFYYSYVSSDNKTTMLTDFTPDPDMETFPQFLRWEVDSSSTGRTESTVLSDGRVQVVSHDAATGDTLINDEAGAGTGEFPTVHDIGGAFDGQPTVAAQDPKLAGTPVDPAATYAIINGSLWYAPQQLNDPQAPYGAWRDLGGTDLTGTPVISWRYTGANIFALTKSGTMKTATLEFNRLSDWVDLGGTGLSGTPSVITRPGYLAEVFVTSGDGTVVTKRQNLDSTFPADWSPIPGLTVVGSPSAVFDPSVRARDAVTARGADNLIYFAYETGQNTGKFGEWKPISDPVNVPRSVAASDPTAFTYDVPSGPSFGVAFQSTDDEDVPVVYTVPPLVQSPAGSAKSAQTAAVPHPKLYPLEKAKAVHKVG